MPTTPNFGIPHWQPNQANPDVTGNTGLDMLDIALAGMATVDATAGGTFTLDSLPLQGGYKVWLYGILKLTGTPGAGFNIVVPLTNPKLYIVRNTTGQTATIKGATGATVGVATNKTQIVQCDGTDVVAITAAL